LQCRNCGSPLDPRRVELGYDYCLKDECQRLYVKRVRLAALGVNKAADYYVRADEVLPPPGPEPVRPGPEEEEADKDEDERGGAADGASPGPAAAAAKAEPSAPSSERRPQSTLERLRRREAELDEALGRSYERFRRNEITAREMEAEQRRLVAEFNQLVMSENIRYRSLLRRKPS
jgi:hypothetical protein